MNSPDFALLVHPWVRLQVAVDRINSEILISTWGWRADWAYARARLVGEALSDSSVYPDEFSA